MRPKSNVAPRGLGEMTGPWGERIYVDGKKAGWNNISGGWLVRHATKKQASAACREANRDGSRFQVRPEKIPPGVRREACEFERQMLLVRAAILGNRPRYAVGLINIMLERNGWGFGLEMSGTEKEPA
jgi:hypothetical protein